MCHLRTNKGGDENEEKRGKTERKRKRKTGEIIICRFVRRTALVPPLIIPYQIGCRKIIVSDNWCRALYVYQSSDVATASPAWQL